MIAVIPGINPAMKPCVIRKIQRQSMISIVAIAYCTRTASAADGVEQLPDAAIKKCCEKCVAAINTATEALANG